jgi:aryl-alcohol dehydrogenase-like predicted oxidoreductase
MIGAAGCSNTSAAQLCASLNASQQQGFPRFEVTQPMYNLVSREIEVDFLPVCRQQNIGVIAHSPLGAGFLTGKYEGGIPSGSRFDVIPAHADIFFSDRNFEIVRRLRALAERASIPMVRLALAWTLRNPDLTAVLIGARSIDHVENALAALELDAPEEWFREICSIS